MDNNIYIKKPNNTQSSLKIWLLRVVVIVLPATILMTVFIYLSIYGFASISFNGDNTVVSLSNNNYVKTINNYRSGSSQLIKKNNYTATVKNSTGSFITSLNTKGFLQTTNLAASLTPEASSTIIATNPYQCTVTIGGILYSYQCTPDSEITPIGNEAIKFKKQFFDPTKNIINNDTIEALSFNQQLMSLVQINDTQVWTIVKISPLSADDVESQEPHLELRQYSNGDFVTPTLTKKIDNARLTGMQPYQKGVILYSKDSLDAYYLTSFDGAMQKIPFTNLPKIDGFGFDIITQGEYITYYYKNTVRDDQMPKKVKNLSVSSVHKLAEPKITKTNYLYTSAFVCSDNTLCIYTQNNGQFIMQNDTKKTLYQVSGYTPYGDKLLLNINNNAVLYDIQKNSGYIAYSGSSDSSICGMQIVQKQIRLCVDSQASGDTYAMQLDLNKNKSVNIIDAMNQIAKNNHIGYITALGNTIFINTDLSQTYDPTTKTYNVNESMRQYAVKTINQAVKDAGVDVTKYQIIIN